MGLQLRPLALIAHAFTSSPVPKIVVRVVPGGPGEVAEVNDAFCALLGYDRAELIGRRCSQVFTDDDRPAAAELIDALIRGEIQEAAAERVLLSRGGTRLWVSTRNAVVRDEHGGAYLVGEILDSTGAGTASLSLPVLARESERLRTTIAVQREITAVAGDRAAVLRLMAERTLQVLPAGDRVTVLLIDVEAGALRVASQTGRLHDMTTAAIPLAGTLAGAAVAANTTLRCVDTGNDARISRRLAESTGTGSLVIAPLRAPGGTPFGALMVGSADRFAFDAGDEALLTLLADALSGALRHAEDVDQLASSERRFAEVFDHSPIAKIVVGLRGADRGRVLMANPAFHQLLGYDTERGPDLTIRDINTRPVAEIEESLAVLAGGEHPRAVRESTLIRADGTHVIALSQTSVVADEQGPATAIVQLLDMTAERKAQAAAARELDRLKGTLAVQREVTAAAADRDAALRVVARRAVELFPAADGAAVEMLDDGHLLYVASAGRLEEALGTRLPLDGTLSGLVLRQDKAAHCTDTRTDPRVDNALCRRLGIGAMMVAPLHAERTVIGVLKISAAEPDSFDEIDEQQLALLADSLSSALRHADDAADMAGLLDQTTRALAALENSENRFRLTFENSPLGVTLLSLKPGDVGRYLQANPAMTAITGYSADELTSMTFADLQHPDDSASTAGYIKQVIAGDRDTVSAERRYRHKDGHLIWVAVRVAVVRDQGGAARYAVNQVEDITARRAAEAQLRQQARLLELIPAAVIVRDLCGTILWWNRGAGDLYGWPLDAALGKITHRLFATGFPDSTTSADQRDALIREGHWSGRLRHLTAGGRTVSVLSRQVLHHTEPGEARVLEINTDVTAARAAEIALAESEQRFRAQFVNSAVGQLVCALDGRIIDANPAYARMVGRTVTELTALPSSAELAGSRHLVAALFAGDAESYLHEARVQHADGHWLDIEATVSLVRDSEDRPRHLIVVTSDISARRAAERARDAVSAALTDRNRELEAANQLKLDIIGMLGHEIGNPLTTIQGNAEILAEDWTALSDNHRTRVVDAIVRQAGRLDEIVREVLAMVTIDAGLTGAERRELAVRDEILNALAAVDRETLPVYGPDATILFHPGHLQQILVNLLSNAAKYGGGATAIHVTCDGGRVQITVEDGGPGVPEEFRDRLFERLARADRDAGTVKGTGLGLYIVRGLAQANRADIHHEPGPAGGSRFVLDVEETVSPPPS
ncbi:PAS domain S-box protein [Actinoplanes sp. NPDC051861]|uniref:PAS domain S-box protein n=1 Tax=Actinoplanes sp. NPDC051861 TaxID=3155170 RepID=UPI00343ADB9D